MRVLCLRHHDEDDAGLIGDAFRERGDEFVEILVSTSADVPSLDGWDYLVVLGSKYATYDPAVEERFLGAEMALIRDADQQGIGVLGICFGAQALCQTFGGSVAPAPVAEIGWRTVTPTPDSPIADGPWFEYHYDHCTLPEQATLWAYSEHAAQAFAIGRHVGTQFHPEIDARQLARWLAIDSDDVRDCGAHPDELIATAHSIDADARQRARDIVAIALRQAGLT
jgi:GMP synthase-like glutamine amidotransferase